MRIKATGTTDRILAINDYSKEIRKVHIELLKKNKQKRRNLDSESMDR